MYPVSDDYISQMHQNVQSRSLTGLIDDTIPFTEDDVMHGSLTLTNQCMANDAFGYGGVYIAQLKLTFTSRSLVNRKNWANKKITIQDGLYIDSLDDYEYVPLGEFYVSEANHTLWGVEITAYDAMSKFDKLLGYNNLSGEPYGLAYLACLECGVTQGQTKEEFDDLIVCPGDELEWYDLGSDMTWRDYLHYLAQACNIFFTIDREGHLVAGKIPAASNSMVDDPTDIRTVDERFDDGSFADFETMYTGISATNVAGSEDITKLYGMSTGVVIDIGVNPFLQLSMDDSQENLIAQIDSDIDDVDRALGDIALIIGNLDDEIADVEEQLDEHPDDPALIALLNQLTAQKAIEEQNKATLEGQKAELEQRKADVEQGILDHSMTYMDARLEIMAAALQLIQYTPATISMLGDPCYDLGDTIRYVGGLAGTQCDLCVMRFDYTYGQRYSITTFGENPKADGAKSRAEKSANASSSKDTDNIEFAKYVNAEDYLIGNTETEIAKVRFALVNPREVETWTEVKFNATSPAKITVRYYLDGQLIEAYTPEETWGDGGALLWVEDEVLHYKSSNPGGSMLHTANFHYHLTGIDAGITHKWEVTITTDTGEIYIPIDGVHTVMWAPSMIGENQWKGFLEAKDEVPFLKFKPLDLLGDLADDADLQISIGEMNIITESGDNLVTESGDDITTGNIEDLPDADPLDGSEYLAIVQNGETVKITTQDIADLDES